MKVGDAEFSYTGKSCYEKIKISLNLWCSPLFRQKRVDTISGRAYDESSNIFEALE